MGPHDRKKLFDDHHDDVAKFYCGTLPRLLLDEADTVIRGPQTGVFLYGLICAVLPKDPEKEKKKQEALLPADPENSHHKHTARLFTAATPIDNKGQSEFGTDMPNWDLDGYRVTFVPMNGSTVVANGKPSGKRPRPKRQPWSNYDAVRSLKKVTNRAVIAEKDRHLKEYVKCRVVLTNAGIEPVRPFSTMGTKAEFEAYDYSQGGKKAVSSTTDTLLAVYDWPDDTTEVHVVLEELDRRVPKPKKTLRFALDAGKKHQLIFAITHAGVPVPGEKYLEHTTGFNAVLEDSGSVSYPVPNLVRGSSGEVIEDKVPADWSSKDGHCEISWDGEG